MPLARTARQIARDHHEGAVTAAFLEGCKFMELALERGGPRADRGRRSVAESGRRAEMFAQSGPALLVVALAEGHVQRLPGRVGSPRGPEHEGHGVGDDSGRSRSAADAFSKVAASGPCPVKLLRSEQPPGNEAFGLAS